MGSCSTPGTSLRDVDRLLNDLRASRKFWRTVAKDELLSADIVWDIYLRASHLYAEMHVALEQAETELKKARSLKHEHTTIMARMEQASRKRYLDDEQEQRADGPRKPMCSSGSESEDDVGRHDGIVYVVTKTTRDSTFSAGDAHCRSIRYTFQSRWCR